MFFYELFLPFFDKNDLLLDETYLFLILSLISVLWMLGWQHIIFH